MNEQSAIERVVMHRVRLLRILGLIISTIMLAVLTFVAALWGVGREVWVARVFENMPHANNFAGFANFWFAAFTHTRLLVQVLTLLTLASFIYLARETARALSSIFFTSAST
ncbi:MAG: hypothetical protein NTY93_02960 [Candidatus Kaiserbacteria bacterium]|nr:hypothetical protein [Candidatus Kaiserbacteria bacterium]